jgi:hypothetical protein
MLHAADRELVPPPTGWLLPGTIVPGTLSSQRLECESVWAILDWLFQGFTVSDWKWQVLLSIGNVYGSWGKCRGEPDEASCPTQCRQDTLSTSGNLIAKYEDGIEEGAMRYATMGAAPQIL